VYIKYKVPIGEKCLKMLISQAMYVETLVHSSYGEIMSEKFYSTDGQLFE